MADQNQGQENQGGGEGGGTQTAPVSGTVQIKPGSGNGQAASSQGGNASGARNAGVTPEPPAKKVRRNIIIATVVILMIVVAGFLYWRSTFTEDTDDAQVDGNLYQVSSRVAGQVVKVYVDEEEPVKAGQLIAEVDPRDFQVSLEQAEAQLANSKAEYVQATANVPITNVQVRTTVTTSGQDVTGNQASVCRRRAMRRQCRHAFCRPRRML